MRTVAITVQGNIATIEWGGEWDGQCCGPEEQKLLAELKKLGVIMELKDIVCALSSRQSKEAVQTGACIASPTETDNG